MSGESIKRFRAVVEFSDAFFASDREVRELLEDALNHDFNEVRVVILRNLDEPDVDPSGIKHFPGMESS